MLNPYQGVRSINFSENATYVLNEWPLSHSIIRLVFVVKFQEYSEAVVRSSSSKSCHSLVFVKVSGRRSFTFKKRFWYSSFIVNVSRQIFWRYLWTCISKIKTWDRKKCGRKKTKPSKLEPEKPWPYTLKTGSRNTRYHNCF